MCITGWVGAVVYAVAVYTAQSPDSARVTGLDAQLVGDTGWVSGVVYARPATADGMSRTPGGLSDG